MPIPRLFVGNIPYSTTEEELRSAFAPSGLVKSVRLITDFDTGRSKGYAFVEMSSPDEAAKAIKDLNNYNMGGRALVVSEARSRSQGSRPTRNAG